MWNVNVRCACLLGSDAGVNFVCVCVSPFVRPSVLLKKDNNKDKNGKEKLKAYTYCVGNILVSVCVCICIY